MRGIKQEDNMKANEVVRTVMKDTGFTQTKLAEVLGYASTTGVNNRLKSDADMGTEVLIKFLSAMNCELVVRSTLKDKREWVIK